MNNNSLPREIVLDLITELKQVQTGKAVYSGADFLEMVSIYKRTFVEAIAQNSLLPYQNLAENVLEQIQRNAPLLEESLDLFRKVMFTQPAAVRGIPNRFLWTAGRATFRVEVDFPEMVPFLSQLKQDAEEIRQKSALFGYMKECLYRQMELEIMPNLFLEGERACLNQGIFVLPTEIDSFFGYYFFNFSAQPALKPKQRSDLSFKLINASPSETLEEALRQERVKKTLGTVAVARNTEIYPLWETVIPLLREKYLVLLEKEA